MSDIHSPHENVNTDVLMNNRISFHGPVFITISLIFSVILPRICGRVKSSDILFQKEEKGHAKGLKGTLGEVSYQSVKSGYISSLSSDTLADTLSVTRPNQLNVLPSLPL